MSRPDEAGSSAAPEIVVHGVRYSVYTRIVRLVLEEKRQPYRLAEVDIFGSIAARREHRARHPFERIPVVDIGPVRLFETGAVARYLDETLPGSRLQTADPLCRARMNQIIGTMDAYAFRAMVWDVFVERVRKPLRGEAPDEARIVAGLATGAKVLSTLTGLRQGTPWLAGDAVTLADLWAAPMLILFAMAPEGRAALDGAGDLGEWLDRFRRRPAARVTQFEIELAG